LVYRVISAQKKPSHLHCFFFEYFSVFDLGFQSDRQTDERTGGRERLTSHTNPSFRKLLFISLKLEG